MILSARRRPDRAGRIGSVEFDVDLKGTNLTNEEARLHTSFLKDIAPLAGRDGLLGLRVSFLNAGHRGFQRDKNGGACFTDRKSEENK